MYSFFHTVFFLQASKTVASSYVYSVVSVCHTRYLFTDPILSRGFLKVDLKMPRAVVFCVVANATAKVRSNLNTDCGGSAESK